jgi:hypothetical protein
MRVVRGFVFASIALAALFGSASAAVLVPVPTVPNSTTTMVFGVNDDNLIAGSFIGAEDGIEHSFFGSLDGNYTTFDAGTGGSEARGISNAGLVVGFSNSQGGFTSDQPAFERKPNGRVLNVTIDGQQLFGPLQGINNSEGKFVGTRWDQFNHQSVAFIGRKGAWKHDVRISEVHQASTGGGINSSDVIVGSFFQPPTHGYIVNGKTLTVVDYPSGDSQGTSLEGINDKGKVIGQWVDSQENSHSFLFDIAAGTFTDIQVNDASTVQAWDINSAGAVAVNSDVGSFIWCERRRQCPADGIGVVAPVHAAKGLQRLHCTQACVIPEHMIRRGGAARVWNLSR